MGRILFGIARQCGRNWAYGLHGGPFVSNLDGEAIYFAMTSRSDAERRPALCMSVNCGMCIIHSKSSCRVKKTFTPSPE